MGCRTCNNTGIVYPDKKVSEEVAQVEGSPDDVVTTGADVSGEGSNDTQKPTSDASQPADEPLRENGEYCTECRWGQIAKEENEGKPVSWCTQKKVAVAIGLVGGFTLAGVQTRQALNDLKNEELVAGESKADIGHVLSAAFGLFLFFVAFIYVAHFLFRGHNKQMGVVMTGASVSCALTLGGMMALFDNNTAEDQYGEIILFKGDNAASMLFSFGWLIMLGVIIVGLVMLGKNRKWCSKE